MWYHKLIIVNRSTADAIAKKLLDDMAARWCSYVKNSVGGCPKETLEPNSMVGFGDVLFFSDVKGNASGGPSDTGPKLEATMKFLQETLNSVGPVTYVGHGHDSNTGQDWTDRFTDQASRVVSVPATCRIQYQWKTTHDGIPAMDQAVGFALRDVLKIDVLTRSQYSNEANIAMGHSSWSATVDPPVFVVRVQRPANVNNHFVFLDESLANHVAKLLTEAVGLCRRGGKEGSQPLVVP